MQLRRNSYKLAEVNLVRQGFRCFQPLIKETARDGVKFKDVLKPLFPGYFFVAFDPVEAQWQKINHTFGVTRHLTWDGIPQAVPNRFIEDLESGLDSTGHFILPRVFEKGDDVYFNSGPFVGLLAQVEHLEPSQRVSLLISLMGVETRLTANITKIRKI